MGNFAFQIDRKISHIKFRVLREFLWRGVSHKIQVLRKNSHRGISHRKFHLARKFPTPPVPLVAATAAIHCIATICSPRHIQVTQHTVRRKQHAHTVVGGRGATPSAQSSTYPAAPGASLIAPSVILPHKLHCVALHLIPHAHAHAHTNAHTRTHTHTHTHTAYASYVLQCRHPHSTNFNTPQLPSTTLTKAYAHSTTFNTPSAPTSNPSKPQSTLVSLQQPLVSTSITGSSTSF